MKKKPDTRLDPNPVVHFKMLLSSSKPEKNKWFPTAKQPPPGPTLTKVPCAIMCPIFWVQNNKKNKIVEFILGCLH